jgi:7-carboxy-7-deazaguanine synthase
VPDGHLRLTERFLSIEGEGLWMGSPVYLVRFSGCNLRCTHCDTKHSSWYDTDFAHVPWQTVRDDVLALPKNTWVSFTGGEPLYRHENELRAFAALVEELRASGRRVKMETSGTIVPPSWFPSASVFWSIAPKTAGMGRGTYCDPDRLRTIVTVYTSPERAHIKFVVGADAAADFAAITTLIDEVPVLLRYPIILQPNGLTASTVEYLDRCRALVAAVQAEPMFADIPNWRVLPQWHTVLWRNTRLK